jgi:hypothetical protein
MPLSTRMKNPLARRCEVCGICWALVGERCRGCIKNAAMRLATIEAIPSMFVVNRPFVPRVVTVGGELFDVVWDFSTH